MSTDKLLVRSPRDIITKSDNRPVVAANGGILLRRSEILSAGSILSGFLAYRTMSTGLHFARRKEQPHGTSHITVSTPDSWKTSIGQAYYEPNFISGSDIRSIQQRQDVLARNVNGDSALVHQWDDVADTLQGMNPKARARVQRAILHILANDAAAVDYTFQLANAHGANLDKENIFSGFTDKAINVVAAHYGQLLYPSRNINRKTLTEFFTYADKGLQLAGNYLRDNVDNLDYIRTRRETDSIHTLSAARTFMDEFPQNPTVVVPLFGAYDIRPALQALGYQGQVEYVLAHEKYIQSEGVVFTRATVTRPIIEDPAVQSMRQNRNPVVIFEDSIGTAAHTLGNDKNKGLIPQLQEALGIETPIIGLRTVFRGDKWYPDVMDKLDAIGERIDGSAIAYYPQDLLGTPKRRTTNRDTTRQRRTNRRWSRRAT